MSYKSVELEQAYDKLEDQYWDLIEWLKVHAPLTLQAYKMREEDEVSKYFDNTKEMIVSHYDIDSDNPC